MLLPRPEIRIATRLGSRIVTGGPILSGVPRARRATHVAASLAKFDPPNLDDSFSSSFESIGHGVEFVGLDDRDHADPAIECAGHFFRRDVPGLLQRLDD